MQVIKTDIEQQIDAAKEFAIIAHGAQKYGIYYPYAFHLENVVKVLGPVWVHC